MTQLAAITEAAQPRARGHARVSAKRRGEMSVIDGLAMSGSMKVLFPRAPRGLDAMLINTAGGVTGGDRFEIEAEVGEGADMTLTTQAAERAYAVRGVDPGSVETRLRVAKGARLNWLPQETILYDRARFTRRLRVDLAGDARFFMVEPLIMGRVAMGEVLRDLWFRDRVEITREGCKLYLDALRMTGDVEAQMARAATMGGARAMAALVYAGPEAEGFLDRLRALLPETAGASLLAPDLLVSRIVAPDSLALRRVLVPAIRLLNHDEIPRPWML